MTFLDVCILTGSICVVAGVILLCIWKKRRGKSGCGSCGNCPYSQSCSSKRRKKIEK